MLVVRVRTPSKMLRVTVDAAATVAQLRELIRAEAGAAAAAAIRLSRAPSVRLFVWGGAGTGGGGLGGRGSRCAGGAERGGEGGGWGARGGSRPLRRARSAN